MKEQDSLYIQLFESLQTYAEEDISDEEVMTDIFNILEEEVLNIEPIASFEDGEYKISRLSIINTVISALLPGYKLIAEVDEKQEVVHSIYLSEAMDK